METAAAETVAKPSCDFPSLSEPLDSFALKDSFIAAYPNFLVIGCVFINNKEGDTETVFLKNSYFKIPTYFFKELYEQLTNIGKFLLYDKQPESNTITIFDTDAYEFQWTIEQNVVQLKIENHLQNKTQLQVDLVQFYFLVNGFKELFFKPFCLKYFITYSFYCLCEQKNKADIERLVSIKEAVETTSVLQLNFKKEELLLVSENIIRYKNELILYLELKTLLPPKPF